MNLTLKKLLLCLIINSVITMGTNNTINVHDCKCRNKETHCTFTPTVTCKIKEENVRFKKMVKLK